MKTMKKIVAILAVALMLCSILPLSVFAADNVADLNTLATNTSYSTRTTTNGWKAINSATAKNAMTSQNVAVILNGKKTAKGTLTSPTLSGGISELSFGYGYSYSESKGVNATINIKDTAGNIVTTKNLVVSSVTQNTAYTFNWKLDAAVTGDFVIEILNNGPTNSTSNKDRLSIWNVTWVSAAEGDCEHEWELISTTAANCTTAGEEYYECASCGESKTEAIAALGHSYGDAVVTIPATCTDAGEQESTCSVCGDVKTETINALPHNYVDDICEDCGAVKPLEATITFNNISKRTEYSTSVQKWEENGIVVINNKKSGNNIRDFANNGNPDNHIRVYKDSEVIIQYPDMVKIEIVATSSEYATAFKSSIGSNATVSGNLVTVTFNEPTAELAFTLTAQARANSITVYGEKKHKHTYDNAFDADCNDCGEPRVVDTYITGEGTSISEDVHGVAAKFNVAVDDLAVAEGTTNEADYTNATIGGYKLITMGVIASNGTSTVDITCKYLMDLENNSAAFAARIKNIPEAGYGKDITFQSYFVVEIDGEQVTIYGEALTGAYNG